MKRKSLLRLFWAIAIFAIVLYFFTAWYIGKYTHGNVVVFMVLVGLMLIGKFTLAYYSLIPKNEEDSELMARAFRDLERARLKKAIQEYEQLMNPKTN